MTVNTHIETIDGCKCLMNTLSWDEIKYLVDHNELQRFARRPKDALRYRGFRDSFLNTPKTLYKRLICQQLQWAPASFYEDPKVLDLDIAIIPSSPNLLFGDPADVKIVLNEFPYNFALDVTHFLVWTKTPILPAADSPEGDISASTRRLVDRYVRKTFVEYLGIREENVMWFRNWTAIQSVKQLSHVHVLVRGITEEQSQLVLGTPGKVLSRDEIAQFSE